MTLENTQVSGNARLVVGQVVSTKMDKTIVVRIERKVKHPLYKKYVRRFTKMYAHDPENTCCIGDIVKIQEGRPLSKLKCWRLIEVVKRQEQ
ncbi:MAG TPA: 30S ribosomal protein S17 [Gammaproteobacteria bacterium]|jgi:small subunit ribosomal protein S17|nr:30S ribosomal protein S17 [Gammaproteobacteria bacterium]